MIGPHTVVRERPLGTDLHGDPVEGRGDFKAIVGCLLYPRGSAEQTGRDTTVVTGKVLLADPGTDLLSTDIVHHAPLLAAWDELSDDAKADWVAAARHYEVEGDPGEWDYLSGEGAALQVALTERRG